MRAGCSVTKYSGDRGLKTKMARNGGATYGGLRGKDHESKAPAVLRLRVLDTETAERECKRNELRFCGQCDWREGREEEGTYHHHHAVLELAELLPKFTKFLLTDCFRHSAHE